MSDALLVGGALAHGTLPPPPDPLNVAAAWTLEPFALAAIALGAVLYVAAGRRLRAWPQRRTACFLSGCAVVAFALLGPIATYAHALFWVHMVQHLLLTMVGAPLLVLGAPLALAMRTMPVRARGRVAAVVHSPPVRALTHPLVAWCAFALVMWLTHFSALYDLALENQAVHLLEHAIYLLVGLLFWWPVAGLDPGAAGRLSHPARLLYLFVALPQQSFLGLAIYSAGEVLYPHYRSLDRPWGPAPLADQGAAGVIMWVVGDGLFLFSLALAAVAWMRHDERDAERVDRRLGLG